MEILKPIVHETIWGGDRLQSCADSECKRIGHLYSTIDSQDMRNEIVSGTFGGKTLHDWFDHNKKRYGLEEYEHLPILMAFVDATQNLSIQVHPADKLSEDGSLVKGKSESFFVLEKPDSGNLYCGCKAQSPGQLAQFIREGRIAELVDKEDLEEGDYIFIPGGTLHAATAGGLYFEIEENSGRTFRFYDYDRIDENGRKRPLQLQEALACLCVNNRGKKRKYSDGWLEENLYATRLVSGEKEIVNDGDMFIFAILLSGETSIADVRIKRGTAILLEPGEKLNTANLNWMLAKPIKRQL